MVTGTSTCTLLLERSTFTGTATGFRPSRAALPGSATGPVAVCDGVAVAAADVELVPDVVAAADVEPVADDDTVDRAAEAGVRDDGRDSAD